MVKTHCFVQLGSRHSLLEKLCFWKLLSEHGEKINIFSFYFSRQHRVAFWLSLPVLHSSSKVKILQQEGVMCCLFGGIARKDVRRTNILLSLRSPVVDRAVFPNAGGNLDTAALETSRTSLTETPSSGWAPHGGIAQGPLGRRKEPAAVHGTQIPHHTSKSHICFWVNNCSHFYLSVWDVNLHFSAHLDPSPEL